MTQQRAAIILTLIVFVTIWVPVYNATLVAVSPALQEALKWSPASVPDGYLTRQVFYGYTWRWPKPAMLVYAPLVLSLAVSLPLTWLGIKAIERWCYDR